MKLVAEKALQRLIEDIGEKPPENAPAGDDATFKSEKARSVVGGGLPAVISFAPLRKTWRSRFLIAAFAVLLAAGGAGFYWWKHSQSLLPAGISFGNGRLEADEIDIGTKFPGRVAELHVDIGDMVTAGRWWPAWIQETFRSR